MSSNLSPAEQGKGEPHKRPLQLTKWQGRSCCRYASGANACGRLNKPRSNAPFAHYKDFNRKRLRLG